MKVEGRFEAARLRNAVEKLVERHEILRTTYTRMPGVKTPFQVVGDSSNVDVTIGPGEFTIELPAMSADAVSLSNIFREVVALYFGVELGEVLQYADYSEWQTNFRRKPERKPALRKTSGRPTIGRLFRRPCFLLKRRQTAVPALQLQSDQ